MHKIYSLLRNNKQSGPHTLEELLHLSLKPFDLVWVEGKSGGWSYPSEIDDLKPFTEEANKTIETKNIVSTPQSPADVPIVQEKRPETSIKKEEILPTAKHIYISLPTGSQAKEKSISYLNPLEEEESPEEKLEQKAQELKNKIQAFIEKKNQPKADDELDTRYTRSLDDIKEEYSTWLYRQKKKKTNFPKKAVFITAGAAALIIGAYFILPLFQNKKSTDEHILSAQEIKLSAPAFQQESNNKTSPAKKTLASTSKPQSTKKTKSSKANAVPVKTTRKKELNQVDSYIDSLKAAGEINPSEKERGYEPSYTKEDGSRQKAKRTSEPISNTPQDNKDQNSAPFEQLVKLSESINGSSPHLTLYNNSNKFIKFVAIDAYYYKANKKLLEKKTLYFNDISAKSSAKLFVPKEKNAASVRYEMGLISTGDGLYYAKQ